MGKGVNVESTIVAAEGQVHSKIGDEVAILDLNGGTYYGLDTVGARVWELIQDPKKVGEVRDALLEEYEVEAQRCEQDLLALIRHLADRGLVKVDGGR